MTDFFAPPVLEENFLWQSLLQLALAFVMATVLRWVYIRYGTSLSNRKSFSTNFYLLAMTITFIISVVKSSLALSLGLVGALSIVRFRTPIKEPEELAYLFLTIAIGIGLGANQILLTVIAFLVIVTAIVAHGFFFGRSTAVESINLSLVLKADLDFDSLLRVIDEHCEDIVVRRFEKNADRLDVGLRIVLSSDNSIQSIADAVIRLDDTADLQFLNPQTVAV